MLAPATCTPNVSEGGFEKMAEIMTVNMFPVTLLTADLLKQMVKRERGVIVNISSIAALNPFYFMAIYSATKKYVNWLSAALRKEYAPQKGIIIQTVKALLKKQKKQIFCSLNRRFLYLQPKLVKFFSDYMYCINLMRVSCEIFLIIACRTCLNILLKNIFYCCTLCVCCMAFLVSCWLFVVVVVLVNCSFHMFKGTK